MTRLRLAAVFALAVLVVLGGAGVFTYARLRADLDDSIRTTLRERAAAADAGARSIEQPEEAFWQVVDRSGSVVASDGGARGTVLTHAELGRARRAGTSFER